MFRVFFLSFVLRFLRLLFSSPSPSFHPSITKLSLSHSHPISPSHSPPPPQTMDLKVRLCVLLLVLGCCSPGLRGQVEEEEGPGPDELDVEDELDDLGEELQDGEVEPEEADAPPSGPPPVPKVGLAAS